MFVTITPQNSVYSTTTAKALGIGSNLNLLAGSYLAGDEIGLSLVGGNRVGVLGTVSGHIAITATSKNYITVGQGGTIAGGQAAVQTSGRLHLVNAGQILSTGGTNDATIDSTGYVLRVINHGLIASGEYFNQGFDSPAIFSRADWFMLENDGLILGTVAAYHLSRADLANSGTIAGGISLSALHTDTVGGTIGGTIMNSGIVGGTSRFGSGDWIIDTTDGRFGEMNFESCNLSLTAENARLTSVYFTGGLVAVDGDWQQVPGGRFFLTGEQARIGSLNIKATDAAMNDLAGSRIGYIELTAERADLDLRGVRVSSLRLTGDIDLVMDGARALHIVTAGVGAQIDARDATGGLTLLIGAGADRVWATSGQDLVYDFGGADRIRLGAGNDSFYAFEGPDYLPPDQLFPVPKHGADTIIGGGGVDWYMANMVALRVNLAAGRITELAPDGAVDRVFGIEAVSGSALADVMIGNRWANTFQGNGGDDTLTGGDGADTFAFAADTGTDLILDFQQGEDVLDLSLLDGSADPLDDPTLNFAGLDPSDLTEGQIGYTHAGDQTIVTAHLPENSADPITIILQGTLTLTEADFLL